MEWLVMSNIKNRILSLGNQPIANGFLEKQHYATEFRYDLSVYFDNKTKMLKLCNTVAKERLFNAEYAYKTSHSKTMRDHFYDLALMYNSAKVIEIGSNDGAFIGNFAGGKSVAVEPCDNMAEITRKLGILTYNKFWDIDLADDILTDFGSKFDLVFSANTMCHIDDLDGAFSAVSHILDDDGVFIFEDPTAYNMILNTSYDQIYDEHVYVFNLHGLYDILARNGLYVYDVLALPNIHGGSLRIICKKRKYDIDIPWFRKEGLIFADSEIGYHMFARNVYASRDNLIYLLETLKNDHKKIIAYGATSKSTVIFNFCNIGVDLIDYIIDTTPSKIGKFSPGMHIPIVNLETIPDDVDYVFLSAWNYEKEILCKERDFIKRGGKFISHVPMIRLI
jgi:methylation protein EvaC